MSETGVCVHSAVMADGRESLGWDEWPGASPGAPGVTEQQSGPGPRPSSTVSGQWEQGDVATPEVLSNNHNERARLWWREYQEFRELYIIDNKLWLDTQTL